MTRPFDVTWRHLFEMNPFEWSVYLGHPAASPGRVRLLDSNLATVSPEADRVLRLEDPIPWLWNIEFQASRDLALAIRLHYYSTLLHHHYELPVRTTLILLREAAFGPDLTGVHELRYPDGEIYDWFRYDMVKLWEQPVEPILAAGLSVLPIAPVAKVERAQVPDVLLAISDRLRREATPDQAGKLWSATTVLMGLRYRTDEIEQIIRGVSSMLFGIRGIEESSVYQELVHRGEVKGVARGALEHARKTLINLGTRRFGPPSEPIAAKITALSDLGQLDALALRILDVATWDDLLAAPSADAS